MKIGKYLLIIVSVFMFNSYVYATPVNTSFDDDNFYKCVVDAYNTKNNTSLGYDTNLTDEQLLTITELSCNGNGKADSEKIGSVNGIDKLTNLKELNLSYNLIVSLDLSHNVNLESLECSFTEINNVNLSNCSKLKTISLMQTKLTSIDLKHNPELTRIALTFNFSLSEIDLSKNTKLTSVDLSLDDFTSLDFSNNTKLKSIGATDNGLSSINVSNCQDLEDLRLSDNNLSSIDLSNNTKLKYLQIFYNKFKTLDISKNVALTALRAHDNLLESLDVSQNINLQNLHLANNNISSIDLSNNTELFQLNLYNNNLSKIDLSNNNKIKYLHLEENSLVGINISNLTNLSETSSRALTAGLGPYGLYNEVTDLKTQKATIPVLKDNGKNIINLKEYDSSINPAKVNIAETDNISYDSSTGIITINTLPAVISYNYITDSTVAGATQMDVTITAVEKKGNIKVVVVDNDGNKIKGAKIGLYYTTYDGYNSKKYDESVTNDNGEILFKELDYRYYNVHSEASIDGYETDKNWYLKKLDQDELEIKIVLNKINAVEKETVTEIPKENSYVDEPLEVSPQTGYHYWEILGFIGIAGVMYYINSKKKKIKL